MPRVAQPPRFDARAGAMLSPQKAPVKIPLNDDREEKAKRFRSKQALHESQMNQIIAAASPVRKRRSMGLRLSGSPGTPSQDDKENDGLGLTVIGGSAVTPMKRIPILANFEEWMKMATDNKINAANSWNFALIDYFHDMSLLKEGDGVNFQKASCTLDGCVKIYTSRVDSVATETGKLLSGLADSGTKNRKTSEEDGAEGGSEVEDEEGEDGTKKNSKKRAQRSSEATLATSFAQLQLKKMELEFSVDPLFKKASADFDEGGAKGLLLNHLTVDAEGRIAFDSSDPAQDPPDDTLDEEENEKSPKQKEEKEDTPAEQQIDIDLDSLAQRFFPDLSRLDNQDICPSLKSFELEGSDSSLDIPFLKGSEDWKQGQDPTDEPKPDTAENYSTPVYDDDEDMGMGGFDVIGDVGFGEGGEAWAKEAAIDTRLRVKNDLDADMPDMMNGGEGQDVGIYEANGTEYGVKLSQGRETDQENILNYFDQALQKNWAGPEHWKIRKIKDITKPSTQATKRKEKEVFEIDFAAPLSQAMVKMLYTPAASNSAISLPKSQWRSKTRNLLPDDKHFNSKQLLRLFLKPKARIGARRSANSSTKSTPLTIPEGERDEAFWARTQNEEALQSIEDQPMQGQYDANFFQDDGLGLPAGLHADEDEDFADAREQFSPGTGRVEPLLESIGDLLASASQGDGFGTQLVTQSRRLRPEYVQYARVATKVDMRRLKEEMWRGIGFESAHLNPLVSSQPQVTPPLDDIEKSLNFTSIMNGLQSVYPKQAMADISTSYCFICLLHLANEKGLVLENSSTFEEIRIQKDHTAEITEGGD